MAPIIVLGFVTEAGTRDVLDHAAEKIADGLLEHRFSTSAFAIGH